MREQRSPVVPDSPAAARDRVHRLLDALRAEAARAQTVRSGTGAAPAQAHASWRTGEACSPRPRPSAPGGTLVPCQAAFAPSRRPARTLAAPAETPSTSSTRDSGRHTESTHRTPLHHGQTLPDTAPVRTGARAGPRAGQCQDFPGGSDRFAGHDVLLVVSELVTNALRHGGGLTGFSLRTVTSATGPEDVADGLGRDASCHAVRVEVADASPQLPHTPADAGPGRVGGHGWALVRKVSSRLEVTLLPSGGKRITAEVPLD